MYIQLLFAKITHSFAKVLRLQLESFPRVSLQKSRAEFNYLRYETLHTRKSTLNFLKPRKLVKSSLKGLIIKFSFETYTVISNKSISLQI